MENALADKPTVSMLYVEDDMITREIVTTMIKFKFPRMTVHCAENGKLALELFRERKPNIVMTDINMPVMDGLQLAAEINSLDAGVPIIFVTAYSDTKYRQHAPGNGGNYYLAKPIDRKRLYAVLSECLDGLPSEMQN